MRSLSMKISLRPGEDGKTREIFVKLFSSDGVVGYVEEIRSSAIREGDENSVGRWRMISKTGQVLLSGTVNLREVAKTFGFDEKLVVQNLRNHLNVEKISDGSEFEGSLRLFDHLVGRFEDHFMKKVFLHPVRSHQTELEGNPLHLSPLVGSEVGPDPEIHGVYGRTILQKDLVPFGLFKSGPEAAAYASEIADLTGWKISKDNQELHD